MGVVRKNGKIVDMPPIKCDICGFPFDCKVVKTTRYIDYEMMEESIVTPVGPKSNPPHLLHNYICDKCYRNLGNAVLKSLIKDYEKYSEGYKRKRKEMEDDFRKKFEKLETEKKEVIEIGTELLKVSSVSDLPPECLDKIREHSSVFWTYHLEDALKYEKERRNKLFTCSEWEEKYGLKTDDKQNIEYPKYVELEKKITLSMFRNILKSCKILNMTYEEFNNIMARIDTDIKK